MKKKSDDNSRGVLRNISDIARKVAGSSVRKKSARRQQSVRPEAVSLLPKDYVLDSDANDAFSAIKKNYPFVFVTGKAGTGKSTFIQYVVESFSGGAVVVAPTGIAALNVRGQTIHSFFRFPPRLFDSSEIKDRRDNLVNNLKLIIIDEISMVRADLMDHIDEALQKWTRKRKPFGGIQVMVVGDLFQLPPVVAGEQERQFIDSNYGTPWFFSAKAFESVDVYAIELKHVYRQADPYFIEKLNRIRTNSDHEDAVTELNQLCQRDNYAGESILILTATNRHAEGYNQRNLSKIPQPSKTYVGVIEGKFGLTEERLPAPMELVLKPSAQVMVTKNVGGVVNGTIGNVQSLDDHSVTIRTLEDNRQVTLVKEKWERYTYKWNPSAGKISTQVVGTYEQVPLMLGWAITIHKCQGLTMDSVFIDLGSGAFAPGQTYVALSRCRTIDGISFAKPISMRDVMADQDVLEFTEHLFGDAAT